MNEKPEEILRGRYQIIQKVQEGGMGQVYLAKDLLKNCQVAVKKSFLSSQAKARKGFENEAKILARLDHSGLPKVLDYFIAKNNTQILVMEFVVGETLEDILESGKFQRGGSLDYEKVLDWTLQILDILRYLHNFDPPIVHRDIKPNNIKLNKEGKIVLLDFGLAKVTSETIIAGKSGYSPIEQIYGAGTDPRSDIYALGTTVFHLLTGQYPYVATDRYREIYGKKTPISENRLPLADDPQETVAAINPQVPQSISEIVAKAMALMPQERFQSATEMKSALLAARQGLERSQTRNFGQQTSPEIVKEWRKPKPLIDENEISLSDLSENTENKMHVAERKDSLVSLIPTKIVEPEPETSKNQKRLEDSFSDMTVSSAELCGEQSKSEMTGSVFAFSLRRTDASIESEPIFEPIVIGKNASNHKISPKTIHLVLGAIGVLFLLSLSSLAWYFFSKPTGQEIFQAKIINEPVPPPKPEEKQENLFQISRYGIGENNRTFPLDENYRLAEGEKFKFNVKSSADGFLYIISHDNNGSVGLAYPNENQRDNDVKKDAEKLFPPTNTLQILENSSPEIKVYFVFALSEEDELVKRIKRVLVNGKYTMNMSSPGVKELVNDLAKMAREIENNEKAMVKIMDIRQK